ncbi:MAG: translation initiation factor IF-2 [Bacteroidales bacterium]|jgi:translation initiation factor IF-2|nr:translation initiation factor IF-2 [Bacteroidales bacterium]
MPIRLIKACKELNIGISTAVDFLAKKGSTIEADPNYRLSDDLYLLLAKEFNKDMALKLEAERMTQERLQKEKATTVALEGYGEQAPEEKQEEVFTVETPTDRLLKLKHVGTIELDEPKTKKEEAKDVREVREVKEEVKEVREEASVKEVASVAQTEEGPKKEVEEDAVAVPAKPKTKTKAKAKTKTAAPAKPIEKVEDVKEEKSEVEGTEDPEEGELFSVSIPTPDINIKIKGELDLDAINQTTRPKAKTREQKKREREEKSRLALENKKAFLDKREDSKKRKKRERFSTQKIDVEYFPADQQRRSDSRGAKVDKDKLRKPLKTAVDQEEVERQIKETLARMAASGRRKSSRGARYRREKRDSASARQTELEIQERQQEKVLKLTEFVTVSELAVMMDISVNQVIATCMSIGVMVSINQRLDAETINIVADEFGFTTEFVSADVVEAIGDDEPDREEDLEQRAPIVTVMGHVDHGKTSLLDYIRKTNVIAGEAGGITQHIGAYNVKLDNGQRITFLDTPGHEAFTAMRARGAKVTDIAIIIVAADDSVMPQTVEAINHASAAGVPIVFAINKIDKPSANPDKIKEALANMNYLVEEWGGKYQSQDISAKQGTGMAELLEKVLLEAELLELKANPSRRAVGSVIESSLDRGRGYVATVLVENGTLKMGDIVLAGTYFGRIKAMFNERNQRIEEARPAEPVLILGLNGAPQAGDNFNVIPTEQEARDIANKREQLQREQDIRTRKHFTLDELGRRIALGDFKELNIIVKGDVDGSVEALADSLQKLSTENIQVNVIHKAVGAISDSDILLAAASNAIICGFQVRPTASARKMAEQEEIDIRLYSVIYDAIEEIKSAMEGMLSPEIKEEVTATIEVREIFKITKVGTIAGCIVREGKVKRNNKVHVIRDGIVIYTGELESLKRFKEDVKEVGTNFECGLNIKNFNDIKVGDIIESFEETEVRKTLD